MPNDNDKKDKKERVIHTRVSEDLDEELKDRAAQLGTSVSNLVRNVLLNTFGLVETVIADTAKAAGVTPRNKPKATEAKAAGPVIGYQALTLNVNALCSKCNAILAKGGQGYIGITAAGIAGADSIICGACVEKVADDDQ